MADLLQHVEGTIQNRRLLIPGQAVLVAVSGGVDSMALLHALHELASRHRWKLTVAHFNHRLRGRSSEADENLVRRTARALKLPLVAGRANVRKFAQQSKLSIEMAARKLRHDFLARAAQEHKIRVVALAHHADDQVELFFLRLLRGAGGEGLAGMKWRSPSPAKATVRLIRPLLGVTKAELCGFARDRKIRFREDATNALSEMPRNRVRNELLPLLRRHYQPALAKTVLRLMDIVGAEAEAVGELARQWLKRQGQSGGNKAQSKIGRRKTTSEKSARPSGGSSGFAGLPVAVQRRALQLQLGELGIRTDYDLVERLRESAGRPVSVNATLSVLRDAAGRVTSRSQSPLEFNPGQLAVALAGRAGEVAFAGVHLRWRRESGSSVARPSGRNGCELFDADRVGGRIRLRHWRPGDRFQPVGLKSAAKLQDLFVNRKIPRARRRELIIATAGNGEIFWVEGLRLAEHFKLTPATNHRLVWRWRRPARPRRVKGPEFAGGRVGRKRTGKVLYTAVVDN